MRRKLRVLIPSAQIGCYKNSFVVNHLPGHTVTWWRHQMETFSALLAFCAGNSPVTGEFFSQRPMTRNSRRSHSLLSCICGNAAALTETQLRAAGAAARSQRSQRIQSSNSKYYRQYKSPMNNILNAGDAAGAASAASAAGAAARSQRSQRSQSSNSKYYRQYGAPKAKWTIYWTQVTQQAQPAQPAQLVQQTQQTQPAHPELQFEVL